MNITAFAGVMGTDSLSKKLVREAVRLLEQDYGLAVDHLESKGGVRAAESAVDPAALSAALPCLPGS